jgi:hypothetical protein
MHVFGLAVLGFVAACSRPAAPPVSALAPSPSLPIRATRTVWVAPDSLPSLSLQAKEALILATGPHGQSTVIALPIARATVSAGQLTVSVDRDPAGDPTATDPGAAASASPAEQLLALQARRAAAAVLGIDETQLAVQVRGRKPPADPAQAALAAAAILAALVDAPIDPAATVLGGLNPDTTVAPVDDLQQQLTAAAAAGYRRVGVPSGHLLTEPVASAVRVVAIADVDDAFTVLTGRRLPESTPVAVSDMEVPAATSAQLRAHYISWRERLSLRWDAVLTVRASAALPLAVRELAERAAADGDRAERAFRANDLVDAHAHIITATAAAAAVDTCWRFADKLRAGDRSGAASVLDAATSAPDRPGAALDRAAAGPPGAAPIASLQAIVGTGLAIAAMGAQLWAADQLDPTLAGLAAAGSPGTRPPTPAQIESLLGAVAPAVLAYAIGDAAARAALDLADLPQVEANRPLASSVLERLVEPPLATARATVAYLEGSADAEAKPDPYLPFSAAHLLVARSALEAVAPQADHPLHAHQQRWQDARWSQARLAAASIADQLLAEQAVQPAAAGPTGTAGPAGSDHLSAALAAADRKARQRAAAARAATGQLPLPARYWFQLARHLRNGTSAEQAAAFRAYWRSSAVSRLAEQIARTALPAPAAPSPAPQPPAAPSPAPQPPAAPASPR